MTYDSYKLSNRYDDPSSPEFIAPAEPKVPLEWCLPKSADFECSWAGHDDISVVIRRDHGQHTERLTLDEAKRLDDELQAAIHWPE